MAVSNILLSVALVASCASSDRSESKNEMYCFELPKRIAVGDLRVRKPDSESRDLLIGRAGLRFYDHEKKSLTRVDPTRWDEAKGVVTESCTYRNVNALDPDVRVGEIQYKLVRWSRGSGDRELATAGRWVMWSVWSFEGGFLAALSRDKEPTKDMKEPATHYVDLFTYPEGKPVGKPYKLPFADYNNIEPVCWSSGDTYVVVSTVDGRHLCIIEVPEQKDEASPKDEEERKVPAPPAGQDEAKSKDEG